MMRPDKVMSGTPLKRWAAQWLFVLRGREAAREGERLKMTAGRALVPDYRHIRRCV